MLGGNNRLGVLALMAHRVNDDVHPGPCRRRRCNVTNPCHKEAQKAQIKQNQTTFMDGYRALYATIDGSNTSVLAGIGRRALSYLGIPDATIHDWPDHDLSLEHHDRDVRVDVDDCDLALRQRFD